MGCGSFCWAYEAILSAYLAKYSRTLSRASIPVSRGSASKIAFAIPSSRSRAWLLTSL